MTAMHGRRGRPRTGPGGAPWLVAALLVVGVAGVEAAHAAGTIEGRVVTGDTREALAYSAVTVIPADTARGKTGGLTQADGTFRIPVPPGAYRVVVQAISYRTFQSQLLQVLDGAAVRVEVVLKEVKR